MKKENQDNLETNTADAVAAVIRGATGAIPFIGNAIAEVILPFIGNQRQDRIAHLIQSIAQKVDNIPLEKLTELLNSPSVANIFEEGILSSMKVYSDKRRDEIANLIVNSLTQETINEEVTIAMIRTLSELNDSEMILLISFSKYSDPDFRKKHENIINGSIITSSTIEVQYQFALMYRKYIAHLETLELLRPIYEKRPKDRFADQKEWDPTKKTGYVASPLTHKLLEIILGYPPPSQKSKDGIFKQ